jgi:hypothetical protein
MDGKDWTAKKLKFHSPAEIRDFSLFHSLQTYSGAHPATYLMGIGILP